MPIGDHTNLLERYQPFADEIIQMWKKRLDTILRVNDLDDNGKVLRKSENLRRMYTRVRAKTHETPVYRGARQTEAASLSDHHLVQRLPVETVTLTNKDAQQECF